MVKVPNDAGARNTVAVTSTPRGSDAMKSGRQDGRHAQPGGRSRSTAAPVARSGPRFRTVTASACRPSLGISLKLVIARSARARSIFVVSTTLVCRSVRRRDGDRPLGDSRRADGSDHSRVRDDRDADARPRRHRPEIAVDVVGRRVVRARPEARLHRGHGHRGRDVRVGVEGDEVRVLRPVVRDGDEVPDLVGQANGIRLVRHRDRQR